MGKHKQLAMLTVCALLASTVLTAGSSQPTYAQNDTRTFPETGKTVRGRFLEYWNQNGGLAQQGFPITEELQEQSDTDGIVYTMQYFERAVFEKHPEKTRPFDVLLSLLGTFIYQQKYRGGAPNQRANPDIPRLFNETGKTIGGSFREYWDANGGLAQQGYPISDEFQEVNRDDGKTYTVQYFQRAVFEFHPLEKPPYMVLLSLLGNFRYDDKYGRGTPPPTAQVTATITRAVVVTPTATATSVPQAINCADVPIPASNRVDILPGNCVPAGARITVTGGGFIPESPVRFKVTLARGGAVTPMAEFTQQSGGFERTAQISTGLLGGGEREHTLYVVTMTGNAPGGASLLLTGFFKLDPKPEVCNQVTVGDPRLIIGPVGNCAVAGAKLVFSKDPSYAIRITFVQAYYAGTTRRFGPLLTEPPYELRTAPTDLRQEYRVVLRGVTLDPINPQTVEWYSYFRLY